MSSWYSFLSSSSKENRAILNDVCKNYYEGLYWVISYYYRGIQSWSWYYRYHYSPFASDLAKYRMYRCGKSSTVGSISHFLWEHRSPLSCSNLLAFLLRVSLCCPSPIVFLCRRDLRLPISTPNPSRLIWTTSEIRGKVWIWSHLLMCNV